MARSLVDLAILRENPHLSAVLGFAFSGRAGRQPDPCSTERFLVCPALAHFLRRPGKWTSAGISLPRPTAPVVLLVTPREKPAFSPEEPQ